MEARKLKDMEVVTVGIKDDIGNNDVIVAKEMGYLRAMTEANTKNIEKFYELLSGHMEKEEKERKAMDTKLTLLGAGVLVMIMKGADFSGGFLGVVKAFFPFLPF